MKNVAFIGFLATATLFIGCTNGQSQSEKRNLTAIEFAEKIKQMPDAQVLDVRTPGEFSKGHIIDAKNVDWNGSDFEKETATLDKSKPVFVYCLSGVRSGQAASKMRTDGFQEVYELEGGIMKWRASNLPETTAASKISAGMSRQHFNDLLDSDKLVLIDFYADWCVPCKLMKPYLDEIAMDMSEQVKVIRINADDNQSICKELKIDALPVLQLYKNKTLSWTNTGFIEKEEVVKNLH